MKSIYLDYAAATPVDEKVIAAMQPFFSDQFYNPSATYLAGRAARRALDEARSSVAGWLGARPGEITFTAGATEANNLVISGLMRRFPDGEVLVSAIEHESVLAPASQFQCRQIPVTGQGITDLAKLEKMITPKTVLVSVMLVNNELGTVQPVKEVAKILNKSSILRKSGLPLYLHSDAAQAANLFDLHVSRLGVDMLSLNGGKIYGPKQSGALYVRAGVELQPLILGGGQERNLRSGTENLAAAAGLAKALELAQNQRHQEVRRLVQLRDFFSRGISKLAPDTTINDSARNQSPHILHVTFPGRDNERLMMQLDEAGVQVAVGSACSASSQQPSHVLKAIGLSDAEARASLRFSFGRLTSKKQLAATLETLAAVLAANR